MKRIFTYDLNGDASITLKELEHRLKTEFNFNRLHWDDCISSLKDGVFLLDEILPSVEISDSNEIRVCSMNDALGNKMIKDHFLNLYH